MKVKFLLILIAFCCLTCWGQKLTDKTKGNTQEITIKKQIIVADLENQVKDIPFAAVRIFVRYKTASWLWKDGKDETGQAEKLAVKAIEEFYENKVEIPSLYANSLKPDIFALLEINAKETAKKLKAKYDFDSEDELNNAQSLLDKKDGEKLAADKIVKFLSNQTELSPMATSLIDQLQSRKSSELLRVLTTILNLEETGGSNFSANSLIFVIQNFRDSTVPNDLRIRFFRIVLNKARSALQFPDSNAQSAFNLLSMVMPDITANAPNLLPEASVLQAALTTRVSQAASEERERFERIENSPDKLSALISEAEKTENKTLKEELYSKAAQLALGMGKFVLAVDLVEKTIGEQESEDAAIKFRRQWHDQFLGDVAQKALKKDDADSAKYATKKIIDKLSMAEVLRKAAAYYFEKQDLVSANAAFDEALKLTTNAETGAKKVYSFIRLIPTIQKIDKSRISEIAGKTAKAIDSMPTLNIDDKPGTENYEKYVTTVMAMNWNLLPIITELVKGNKNEAIDFANRINRKEIKVIAGYALAVDSLNVELKPQ